MISRQMKGSTMKGKYAIRLLTLVVALAAVANAAGASERSTGALELNAAVASYYRFDPSFCPAGVQFPASCVRFTGEGTIRGLGAVTTTYTKVLPGNDESCIVIQNNTAVIAVAGKGTLEVFRPGKVCTAPAPLTTGPYTFTVTGGTGAYTGASGTLTFRTSVGSLDGACQCGSSQDSWAGEITVPGLDFDLTAPRIMGAVAKTVKAPRKAKSMRVRYTAKATDAVDGAVATKCTPRSGSAFKVGRTKVTCSATDSSGNTAKAQFAITVKRS
jgi:HYR domain